MSIIENPNDQFDVEVTNYLAKDRNNLVFFFYVSKTEDRKFNESKSLPDRKLLLSDYKTNVETLLKINNEAFEEKEIWFQLPATPIHVSEEQVSLILKNTDIYHVRVYLLKYHITGSGYFVYDVIACEHGNPINPDNFVYPRFDSVVSSININEITVDERKSINEKVQIILGQIYSLIGGEEGGYIPIGTKLYHASVDEAFIMNKSGQTFFGLDVVISLWMIAEKTINTAIYYGYLYEFEVVRPIKISAVITSVQQALEATPCTNPNDRQIVCIHPAYAPHGDFTYGRVISDLGVELTMNLSQHGSYIRLVKKYIVDASVLLAQRDFKRSQFNPVSAIVCEVDAR